MMILIKGAGDLASAVAVRLHRAGYDVAMTEIARPTTVRRTVAFSPAVYEGHAKVEDVEAILVKSPEDAKRIMAEGKIPVLIDPEAKCRTELRPEVIVDAILAKKNIGTGKDDAPLVVALGPGFTPGTDCDCAVETQRGHYLGRVLWDRPPAENTGVPGVIEGVSRERILRATEDGVIRPVHEIGDSVKKGEVVAYVDSDKGSFPILALIDGVVRGMLQPGVRVHRGMKSGDVDPRGNRDYCLTVSDKGSAIGGAVLEAVSAFAMKHK